jgi:hypothetical protein
MLMSPALGWRGVLRKTPVPGLEETAMKETWSKPQVTELEVTSYVAAEIADA